LKRQNEIAFYRAFFWPIAVSSPRSGLRAGSRSGKREVGSVIFVSPWWYRSLGGFNHRGTEVTEERTYFSLEGRWLPRKRCLLGMV